MDINDIDTSTLASTSTIKIETVKPGSSDSTTNIATIIGAIIFIIIFLWIIWWYRNKSPRTRIININSATYGQNCDNTLNNNVKSKMSSLCDGTNQCNFIVNNNTFGVNENNNTISGCSKNLKISYSCGLGNNQYFLDPIFYEGDNTNINCNLENGKIHILSGSYGTSCDPKLIGNVTTKIIPTCENKNECTISTQVNVLGNPTESIENCVNDLTVFYKCNPRDYVAKSKTVKYPDSMFITCDQN
jgi:hypothetical protein